VIIVRSRTFCGRWRIRLIRGLGAPFLLGGVSPAVLDITSAVTFTAVGGYSSGRQSDGVTSSDSGSGIGGCIGAREGLE